MPLQVSFGIKNELWLLVLRLLLQSLSVRLQHTSGSCADTDHVEKHDSMSSVMCTRRKGSEL